MTNFLMLDLDGTLIDTPHYEAWNLAIHALALKPITMTEYLAHVAGRPRIDGALSILKIKNISDIDSQLKLIAKRLADNKQKEFMKIAYKVTLFEDARSLLHRISTRKRKTIFYTASLNAARLFELASLKNNSPSIEIGQIIIQQANESRRDLFKRILGSTPSNNAELIDDAAYAVKIAAEMGIRSYHICRSSPEKQTIPNVETLTSLDDYKTGEFHDSRTKK